jgi:hypothetical protein
MMLWTAPPPEAICLDLAGRRPPGPPVRTAMDESISLAVDVARAHLHDENMTDAQRAWLRDFVRRWEREQG